MYVIRDKIKYRAKVRTKSQSGNTGFTDGLRTIYGHLARFVESGDLSLSEIIPQERQDAIMKVIRRIGKEEGRTAIKNLCPPDVTYAEIELVLLCLKA